MFIHALLRAALIAVAGLSLFTFSACGVSAGADSSPLEDAEVTAARADALVSRNCRASSNSYTRTSGPFSAATSVAVVGGSDDDAWAEATLTPSPGTTRTTVNVAPTFEAGLGINIAPGPGVLGLANVTTSLTVTDDSGRVLCSRSTVVLNRSTPIGPLTDSRPRTTYPMSCSFSHDASGRPVTARVSLFASSDVTGAPPLTGPGGTAESRAFGTAGAFTQTHCETELAWCTHDGARLLALDANADGLTDHVCLTASTGHLQVNTTPVTGIPDDVPDYDVVGFCRTPERLLIGDVNRDGRDDLVCINEATRRLRIDFADGFGLFNGAADRISTSAGSCPGAVLADFNGDGADDLQCNAGTGRVSINFSDSTGMFPAPEFEPPTFCEGGSLHVADLNADGRADQLCHAAGTGNVKARFADGTGRFSSVLNFDSGSGAWCSHVGARLVLADANGDRRADLVCVTAGTGWIHADFASPTGQLYDFVPERSADRDFCSEASGILFPVRYANFGGSGLVCQVPAAPPSRPFGRNTLQPRL